MLQHNPEGIATVTFKEVEEADLSVMSLNNRWFAKRKIMVETWDGKTKFKIEETEEDKAKRIEQWENFLKSGSTDKEVKDTKSSTETDDTQLAETKQHTCQGDKEMDVQDMDNKSS